MLVGFQIAFSLIWLLSKVLTLQLIAPILLHITLLSLSGGLAIPII